MGSVEMLEHPYTGVGVFAMNGVAITAVGVGGDSVSLLHALRIKTLAVIINKIVQFGTQKDADFADSKEKICVLLRFSASNMICTFVKKNKICFIYGLTAFCNCSKLHIHDMALTKSASDALCSLNARTAGPTGSSPAAPPGASA